MGYYPPPQPAPAAKSSNLWIWIIGGIFAFVLVIVLAVGVTGFMIFQRVKDAGFDEAEFRKNPAIALSRLATALNPDFEVIKVDENSKNVIVREKSTGKTITLAFDEEKKMLTIVDAEGKEARVRVDQGKDAISVESEKGSFQAGQGNRAPGWVPAYPGSRIEGSAAMREGDQQQYMYSFETSDSIQKVAEGLRDAGKKAGFAVEMSASTPVSQIVTLADKANGRKVIYTLAGDEGKTSVAVVATESGAK